MMKTLQKVFLKKAAFAVLLLCTVTALAQTNPTAQPLPYSFTSLSNTNLPAGMAVHRFGTSSGAIPTTRTTANGTSDLTTGAGSSGGYTSQGSGGISMLASGSNAAGALVVAVVTTGKQSVTVSWKAGTILQQASRDNSVALQYRVGNTGTWTDVGTTTTYSSEDKAAGHYSGVLTETLPDAANNKPVVQVRWIYWESGGSSGSRDRIAIDDISITATTTPTTSAPTVATTQVLQASVSANTANSGGNVTANGGANVSARGVVWNTSTAPSVTLSTKTNEGTGNGAFTSELINLSSNTRYYYRAYATNSAGTGYGTEYSFYTLALTPGAPVVDNPTMTSLDVTVAANGNNAATQYAIRVNGGQYVNASGDLQDTPVWRTAAQWATVTVNLSAGTTYSFDVKARNGANIETAFGPATEGTTTSATAPYLSLVESSLNFGGVCTNSSATGYFIFTGANLTSNASIVVFPLSGFTYSLSEAGEFASALSVTNYNGGEVKVYVKFAPAAVQSYDGSLLIVGQGDNSAAQLNVPASGFGINTPASVTTTVSGASDVTSTSATLAGQATPGGCTPVTSYGIEYSTVSGFAAGSGTTVAAANINNSAFTVSLSSLLPGTTYYYRAFAVDNNGAKTNYGALQQFTTSAIATPVATAGTNVTQTTFTANWTAVDGASSYRLDVSKSASFSTASPATELFISEYVEGNPGNQKAIEIFNGTANPVDLSSYTIRTQTNGSTAWTSERALSGTIAPGDVYVIVGGDTSTADELVSAADLFLTYSSGNPDNRAMFFTGNDAIGLFKQGTLIDVVGISTSLTTEASTWGTDKIAVRKASVTAPSATFDADQWNKVTYAIPAIQLGGHTFDGAAEPDFIAGYNNREVTGTSHTLTGLDPFTTYHYRVRASSNNSTSGNSNIISITTKPSAVTWNGTAWTPALYPNGDPVRIDTTIDAVIAGDYNTAANGVFTAKNIIVNNGIFTVSPLTTLTVENAVINNLAAAHFVVENNGNLLQNNDSAVLNSHAITVKRNSSELYRQDYTMWSSPVAGQNLRDFSPVTLESRFYTYSPANDQFAATSTGADFETARGYLIRMPNGGVDSNGNAAGTTADPYAYQQGSATMVFNGTFSGVPNNGDIRVNLSAAGNGFNFVGNPYPSPILISELREANQEVIDGTIWVWRKKNASNNTAYCTVNSVGIYTGNGEPEQEDPSNVIRTGQGFIVKLKPGYTSTDLVFNNGMRSSNTSNQFFRQSGGNAGLPEAHGIWLNLTNSNGFFSQMYTGYIEGATTAVDYGIDSKYIGDNATVLANNIDNAEYIIQGRSLPFSAEDVVPLRFKAAAGGTFTIAIDHVNGLFAAGQEIFLKDKLTGTLHNLTTGSYSFATQAGDFTNRFDIVYQNAALGVDPVTEASGVVVVYKNAAGISVTAGSQLIKEVVVYDIRGRMLLATDNVNATETTLTSLTTESQVLIVKVTLANGATSSKKVAY